MTDNNVIPAIGLAEEPARAAGERDTLVSFLDYFRSVLLRQAAGLTTEQLGIAVAASDLTLGRLLRHMAFVEDHWFRHVLRGEEYADDWAAADWDAHPDWEMDTAAEFAPTELAEQFDRSVRASRAAIADVALDDTAARETRGGPTNLRWILIHMIEEYARHCGHADLIREAIDGRTGD